MFKILRNEPYELVENHIRAILRHLCIRLHALVEQVTDFKVEGACQRNHRFAQIPSGLLIQPSAQNAITVKNPQLLLGRQRNNRMLHHMQQIRPHIIQPHNAILRIRTRHQNGRGMKIVRHRAVKKHLFAQRNQQIALFHSAGLSAERKGRFAFRTECNEQKAQLHGHSFQIIGGYVIKHQQIFSHSKRTFVASYQCLFKTYLLEWMIYRKWHISYLFFKKLVCKQYQPHLAVPVPHLVSIKPANLILQTLYII